MSQQGLFRSAYKGLRRAAARCIQCCSGLDDSDLATCLAEELGIVNLGLSCNVAAPPGFRARARLRHCFAAGFTKRSMKGQAWSFLLAWGACGLQLRTESAVVIGKWQSKQPRVTVHPLSALMHSSGRAKMCTNKQPGSVQQVDPVKKRGDPKLWEKRGVSRQHRGKPAADMSVTQLIASCDMDTIWTQWCMNASTRIPIH